jgi:histidyl-tRNA synthetase
MRTANKLEAPAALIRGNDELAGDMVVCKNLSASEQLEIAIDDLPAHLQSILDTRFTGTAHAEE